MRPLSQVRSIEACAPDHTAKVHKKLDTTRSIIDELRAFASSVPDFRRLDKGNIRHRLDDIIMLMILGRLAGYIKRAEIMEFGRHNLHRLRKMGILRNGVPSEATLCRVENGINDMDMADRMQQFAEIYLDRLTRACHIIEIICIDGKAERGIWAKLKAKVLEAINKFLGSLKLPKRVRLGDNELRYMLWRSHERLRTKGEYVDLTWRVTRPSARS